MTQPSFGVHSKLKIEAGEQLLAKFFFHASRKRDGRGVIAAARPVILTPRISPRWP